MFLVNYSSSSEEEEVGPAGAGPRLRAEGAVGGAEVKSQQLPVPESVMGMFKELEEELDDSIKHDGRIRSFPHQRGNWSTLVYLEYYPEEEFMELIDLLLTHLQVHKLPMARLAEFHISLSQTVVLRYHWINIFVESLKEKMSFFDRFYCVSDKVKIYVNQEKTRTFLGLEVSAGSNYLLEMVNEVDKSMKEFNLKTYHKKPSFHISVAWCLGDATAELEKHQQELQAIVDRFEDSARILQMFADQVRCKTGNKIFSFQLR
ncbi:U6 snRNA phosphodiesterase isoform X1 [Carcharodon carcharias]|uniref:U6 snRNA phosphodiesterase isoform X1 n=2 Tax=Carcharodon carcharias TaxID=13397 RepID=UPI001B7EB055|nr:U6 snRNA phosphodiesterase isoform X1 [Carcharodon carcharias]